MLMPGERPSQHGHSSNPSTTFSGPSSLNVSTTLCSLMVILLCPLPLLRQGVCFGCALIAHHFSGATPSPKLRGCTAIPTPARATCGRDKRRPGRVRLGGGALAVESDGHQWKRAERTAIRSVSAGPHDGCER